MYLSTIKAEVPSIYYTYGDRFLSVMRARIRNKCRNLSNDLCLSPLIPKAATLKLKTQSTTSFVVLSGRSSLTYEKDHHYFLNRFVCVLVSSLMTDQVNSSSKLSVASRASQCHGISWWYIGNSFAFFSL